MTFRSGRVVQSFDEMAENGIVASFRTLDYTSEIRTIQNSELINFGFYKFFNFSKRIYDYMLLSFLENKRLIFLQSTSPTLCLAISVASS